MRPTAKQQAKARAEAGAEAEKDTWLQQAYLPVLNWTLGHRWITLLIAAGLFAGTLALVPATEDRLHRQHGQREPRHHPEAALRHRPGRRPTPPPSRIEASWPRTRRCRPTRPASAVPRRCFMGSQADTNQATFTVPLKAGATPPRPPNRLRQGIADLGPSVGDGRGVDRQRQLRVHRRRGLRGELGLRAARRRPTTRCVAMMKGVPGLTNVTSDLGDAREHAEASTWTREGRRAGA